MAAKICQICRHLKEIKGKAVVCDECLQKRYEELNKQKDGMDKKELIKLYEEYLADTVEERTFEIEGKRELWKGDFDGFINWLKEKPPI